MNDIYITRIKYSSIITFKSMSKRNPIPIKADLSDFQTSVIKKFTMPQNISHKHVTNFNMDFQ